MQITENASLNWSQKINADSRNRDLLGIYSHHLKIQTEFTRGITSVTPRIRYYTFVAYYFEYLRNIISKENIKNYERIFILCCLAHHNGDFKILDDVHNKTRFRDDWDKKSKFDLKFKISGQGWSYYVKQLETLRCAWKDEFGVIKISKINKKLANSLSNVTPNNFRNKQFSKDELRLMGENGFCICNTKANINERDLMSKLLFGFFSKKEGEWDIDLEEYNSFQNGYLNLDFEKITPNLISDDEIINMSIKRRNTLFMFLKIIKETTPSNDSEYNRFLWDAIYFCQNRGSHEKINFGKLEPVRKYWELSQLNIYYMFTLEMFLDLISDIIKINPGIKESDILRCLNIEKISLISGKLFNINILNLPISNFINFLSDLNNGNKTSLDSLFNESYFFDSIKTKDKEERLLNILIMIFLLYIRYCNIDQKIKDFAFQDKVNEQYSLSIDDIFNFIQINGEVKISEFLDYLCNLIVKKHLFESILRLYDSNTRKWLFLEENGHLYTEDKIISYDTRANRWYSITSLLNDLEFIDKSGKFVLLTSKGIEWLKKIE